VAVGGGPGHGPAARSIEPSGHPGDALRTTLTLHAGAPVSGTVVDDAGARVAGATVCARPRDPERAVGACAASEIDGRWRIPALSAGRWAFLASTDVHVPEILDGIDLDGHRSRDDLVVEVHAGAKLVGRVVDERGAGVSGAAVRVRAASLAPALGRRGRRAATCDEEGHFEMRGLPREIVDVVAERGSASSDVASVDLSNDLVRADVLLALVERKVKGLVVTSSGEPAAGARVRAFPGSSGRDMDRLEPLLGTPTAFTLPKR